MFPAGIHHPLLGQLIHQVVTELLQFAAVMTPNDAAAGSTSTNKQLEELMPMGQCVLGFMIAVELCIWFLDNHF